MDNLEEGESPFMNSAMDYYECRPDTLESLTLAVFEAYYEIISKKAKFEECDDNFDDESEKNNKSPVLLLKNNMGKIRRRTRPAIIR